MNRQSMSLKQPSEQRGNEVTEQFGFIVGEYVSYEYQVARITSFPSKWSAEIRIPITVGAVCGSIKETVVVSILQINKVDHEKR